MSLHPLYSNAHIILFALLWAVLCGLWWRGSSWRFTATLGRRLALGVVIVGALLGPAVPAEEETLTSNVEVYIGLDRTGSMAAEDWNEGQPRLDGVREGIRALVDGAAGARFSVVTWSSEPQVELPVTTDSSAVLSLADSLHQEISDYSAGSSINTPAALLADTLTAAAGARPENFRYLVLFTDGETTDQDDAALSGDWTRVADAIDGGAIAGYGTPEGAPMRVYEVGAGPTEDYIPDPDDPSQPGISRLDEESLNELGDQLGVSVVVNPTPEEMTELGASFIDGSRETRDERSQQRGYRYVIWPLGIAAAALLIWELGALTTQVARLRRSHVL